MNTLHIKTGDTVKVLSGNQKGQTGKVVKVFPKTMQVLVEGIGMHKKHQKSRREGQKGQIVDKHFPFTRAKSPRQNNYAQTYTRTTADCV
jgi:large subunit ribosomal protein L24